MNRRLTLAIGALAVTTIAAALVLVGSDAPLVGRQPPDCAPHTVHASGEVPNSGPLEAGQLVFAGLAWQVRTFDGPPTTVGTWGGEQASVRDDGALVLRQQLRDGVWHNAEVQSVHQGFGYGTYEWTIESPLGGLDPVAVLGLFTFEQDAPGREIDIEAAQWGDADADNMNYVSWFPARRAHRWTIDVDGPTTHLFTWGPEEIVWCSRDADGEVLARSARRTAMEPGDERVHMNLWVSQGRPPAEETEIVITDFRFRPLEGDRA